MIYFYVYPSAFQNPGGGEILLLKTKEFLEKMGVRVSLFDMWHDRLEKIDILHVFGSVKEALGLMEVARTKGVTIVHSPIIWYNWQSSLGIAYNARERMLCVMRQCAKTFFPVLPSARRKMMQLADLVLASSQGEAEQINRYFSIPKTKIGVIHYGVDERFGNGTGEKFKEKYGLHNFILTVGRIEPRKNQLCLIRAAKHLKRELVIIGQPVTQHLSYYEKCKKEGGSNTHFLGGFEVDSEMLQSAYSACEVFVLPSWFETPGLAALEAALAGAKLVITREGATWEYFRDFVEYINPGSEASIKQKLDLVLKKKRTTDLSEYIRNRFLWKHTADETNKAYEFLRNIPKAQAVTADNE